MLKINKVSKTYANGKVAIKQVNLHIEAGDMYGFIGANGAGKTTLLKAIVGIHSFEGEILVNNISVKADPLGVKREIAYIPDSPDLYKYLTGIEYIRLVADLYELKGESRKEKIKYYSDLFEMTEHLSNEISSYSHGMRQRVAVIAALIHEPKLMLLDEPFVGLDPKATILLRHALEDICKQGGSVFFSTHVLEVAEKICNKIAIIKDGSIVAAGWTKELTKNKSLEDIFLEVEGD